ncbi:MAG: PA14 domain-containing protein [Coleofasciculus sp.]|uniref:PA14 domain-containing protein n=1 Tax=Coleofasciculus sp. TaxID=3100458 RepID=UPI003A4B063F
MSWFNFSSKKRPDAQGFASKKKGQELPQAFILEPILTPSGLLDGTDNSIDPVDIDISADQIADIDIPEIEEGFGDISDNNLEEIAFVTSVAGEETLEEIPFVTSLDDVAESEATDEALTEETLLNESLLTGLDSSSVTFESGVFTVGQTGEVSVDFLFDGGGYEGELAVFSLEGMEEFEPGSEAFIQEAASRALSDSELGHIVISDQTEGARFVGELGESDQNSGEYLGVKTVQMRPGDEFGFMLVPNNTVQRVFDNPDVGGAARPLFSMATANPEDAFHTGQIADVTGDGSTFVMEDLRVDTKSDGDYNDVIFQVRGATGEAALMDEVIESGKDWRETDLGQALIDYAEPYITPDTPDDGELLTDELVGESPTDDIPVDESEIVTEPTTDESTDVVIDEPVNNSEIVTEPTTDASTDVATDEPVNNSEIVTEPTTDSELAEPVQYEFPQENQPLVGIIDTGFSDNNPDIDYSRISLGQDRIDGDNNPLMEAGEGNEHGTHVLGTIGATQDNDIGVEGINDDAPIWVGRAVGSGQWAESLVEFVDAAQESGQPNAVVNLSMDLTQIDADGNVTTRYEFTPQERSAIEYARQNNVMLVVAAGNDGDVMSVLGQASQEFDNILTVGAAEQFDPETSVWKGANRTDYSSHGHGLDVMAYGGTVDNPQLSLAGEGTSAMAGTSVATAKVTGAVSQVWAANPELSYRQVAEIIKNTATDLGSTGQDAETGAGLLNIAAAVNLAKATSGEEHDAASTLIPETWGGEGVFTAGDRAVNSSAPTLTVHNLHASPNQVIPAANFFSVTHQDGNPILQYKFYSSDRMPGSGYFTLNGVKTGVSFTINADQLKDLQFVSGSEPGKTQTFSIRASDGKVWSSAINAVINPQTINGSIQENKQPEIIVHNRAFKPGETVPLSTLFSVNDADGDAMQIYHIYDRDHGDNSGYITLNGVRQSGSIYVNASQLKDMQFVASSEAGKTETLAIRAFDGKHWSQYGNFVANPLPINGSAATNRLPVISTNNVALSPGATVAGASLFSVQDSDGDDMQSYYFHNRDSSSDGSYFTLNGVKQPRTLYINASQLKDLQFVAGSEPDKEQSIVIAAFDGKHWSDDLVVPINSSGSAQSPTDSLSSVAQKAIDDVYKTHNVKLGQPIDEPVDLGNGFLKQTFKNGHIIWNGQKAIPYFTGSGFPVKEVPGNIPVWSQIGFDGKITHAGFIQSFNRNGRFEGVGFPTGYVERWEQGQTQQFTGGRDGQGAIMKPDGSSNAYWVGGKIWQEFLNRGGAEYVGYPKTDAIRVKGGLDNSGGKVQHFRGAKGIPSKIWSSKHGAHPTWGAIGGRYDKMGGSSSWLGFPTSGEKGIGNGWVKQDFEGGYMLWHPQHGTTVYNTKAVNSLPPDSGHGSTDEWTVKYWNNTNLSGVPAWTMTEPPGEIRFNAGSGAPVGTRGVKEDNFSTRWETTSHFDGGFYNFISQADDGVRVYVNGVKVIDKWKAGEPWSRRDAYIAIPEGEHKIVVEYFEKGGIAGQTFKWEPSGLLNDWTGDFRPVGYDGRSVHSTYVNTYQRNGAIPELGYPINNVHVWEGGHTQDFEGGSQGRGAIMKSNANDNSYWVGGQIWTKFMELGGARSVGYPKTDAIPVKGGLDKSGGQVQHFRGGRDGIPSKIWLSKHGAHPTWGAIGGRYDKMGGPSSWLGFPTSREQGIGNGWVKQDFEGGYILWHPQYGTTVYDTQAINKLPPDSGNSSTSNWHAQYWNNKNLTGSPQWSKYEEMSDLRFHAGGGAPVGTRGIKEDQFGARWITTSYFDGGIYNFINQADDGVRVYVDGKLIIDKWKDSPFEERRAFAAIEPGYHQVMVEYHENKGSAANLLRWEQANPPKEWAIEFFRGKDLNPKNLAGYRGGGTGFLNKDWGQGHEWGIPIGDDDFSDRSTTTRYFNEPGVYEFTSKSDDGVRVWINDQLVIDQWKLQALTTNKVLLALDKGYHRIRVEHYEDWGGAAILFDWKKVAGEPIYTYQPLDLDGGNSSGSGWLQPWVAEYYNNRDLQGAPVVTRIVNPTPSGWLGDFDLNWSQGSPDSKVSQDNFSSRLTTHRYLREGTYNFKLKGDDGVRVFINGEKVIDRWSNPPYDTPYEEEIVLPSGIHRIEVEHSEKYGRAYVGLDWDYLSDSSGDAVAPQLATIHAELEQQLGEGAVGVPVDNLQQKYYASPIPSGSYGPMWILPAFYQEFRGTQGRGAIFADTGHYVFGKLWEAYQNGGGVTQFGPPVASQKDLGNGAYELELQNGRLFWAPGMTNPTYYEYALGTPKTLTIPADAWRGEYFDNRNWAGDPLVVSQDSGSRGNLDKYWNSSQSPAPGMPKDNFSVRWTTNRPFDRGTYRFKADHDDGFIVSVNGQKPIDKMKEIATQTTGYATFTKGGQYPVEVKHREYGGGVRAKLGMEKASKYVVGLDANNNLSRELPGAFQKHGGYDRVGLPINDVHGWHHGYVQDFDHGKNGSGILMRRHNTNAFYYIHGKIWDTYLSKGGPRKFGYPTGDARDIGKGITYQPFQHGYIQIMGDGSVRAHTYNYKEFVGWAMPNRGTAHRHTPNLHHRTGGATGYKQWLTFDAWTHGETATDTQLGTPDSRWFRIKGTNTWVPSAYIFGNPEGLPGGGGGDGGSVDNGGPITNLEQYIHRLYGGSPGYRSQDYHPDHLALDTVHQGAYPHKVYSLTGGTVKHIGTDQYGGKYVTVWNEELQRTFLYLHFNSFNSSLKVNQKISAGHYLGNEGWTGYTRPSGPGGRHTHVHVTRPNGTREHPITALSRLSSGNSGGGDSGGGDSGGGDSSINWRFEHYNKGDEKGYLGSDKLAYSFYEFAQEKQSELRLEEYNSLGWLKPLFLDVPTETMRRLNLATFGGKNAVDFFKHYLSKSGKDKYFDLDRAINDSPALKKVLDIDGVKKQLIDKAKYAVKDRYQIGSITHGFQGAGKFWFSNPLDDWYLSLGAFDYSYKASFYWEPTSSSNPKKGQIKFKMTTRVADTYNFNLPYLSEKMLHTVGLAKNFFSFGEKTIWETIPFDLP